MEDVELNATCELLRQLAAVTMLQPRPDDSPPVAVSTSDRLAGSDGAKYLLRDVVNPALCVVGGYSTISTSGMSVRPTGMCVPNLGACRSPECNQSYYNDVTPRLLPVYHGAVFLGCYNSYIRLTNFHFR